jgi:hypothetical protein
MGFSQIKIDFSLNKIKDKLKLEKTPILAKIVRFELTILLREKLRRQEMICQLGRLIDI